MGALRSVFTVAAVLPGCGRGRGSPCILADFLDFLSFLASSAKVLTLEATPTELLEAGATGMVGPVEGVAAAGGGTSP